MLKYSKYNIITVRFKHREEMFVFYIHISYILILIFYICHAFTTRVFLWLYRKLVLLYIYAGYKRYKFRCTYNINIHKTTYMEIFLYRVWSIQSLCMFSLYNVLGFVITVHKCIYINIFYISAFKYNIQIDIYLAYIGIYVNNA